MSNLESALYSLITGSAGFSNLASARLYPVFIPQDIALPAAAYQVISRISFVAHDGATGISQSRVQFDCDGTTYAAAKQLAEALVTILNGYRGDPGVLMSARLSNMIDGYSLDPDRWTVRVDFLIVHEES
jgi:hypothetical protein